MFNLFGKKKKSGFAPNLKKTEYENWLDFVGSGGTSSEWKRLTGENKWRFDESKTDRFVRYQKEVKTVSARYYKHLQEIEKDWSALYHLGAYKGQLADILEKKCLANIADYKKMKQIDQKYGEKTATNIPAFRRLAMLYEKQERFEESIEVCKQAYSCGMDERSRMIRMIKKAKRNPTPEEIELINK